MEAAHRAYDTGKAQLAFLERQRGPVVEEVEALRARLVALDTEIISAEMAIQQLERAREIEVAKATDLRARVRVAELKADENAATIKIIREAMLPEEPVSPNPYIVFTAGCLIGVIFGTLFVLLLDKMEDKLVGVTDIEQRLRLKALAVFPHLRRKQRAQVALTMHDDPFSPIEATHCCQLCSPWISKIQFCADGDLAISHLPQHPAFSHIHKNTF